METFIAVTHIIVALILIALVLLQDSKSGSVGGAFGGGGGSNSVFGATGATTLAQKITRYTAVIFAATSIALSVFAAKTNKSLMDNAPVAAPAATSAPATTPAPTGSQTEPATQK